MDNSTETYIVFVVLGVVLVITVGQFIVRAGQVYLEETFPDPRVARSVSRLLTVMFYLFGLGVLGIISTMDVPVDGAAQTVVTKLGVILLVLGIVFGLTMLVLSRIRARRQEEEQEETFMAASMPGAGYGAVPGQNDGTTPGATSTSGPASGSASGAASGPADARLVQPTPPPAV